MNEVPQNAPIRLLLADDHQIFRDGLKFLLLTFSDIQLVAELSSLTELRSTVKATEPALLLLDYHMPGGDTGAEIQYLKQRWPTLKIIVLTGSQSAQLLQQVAQAGADAVLQKNGDAAELRQAITAVMRGEAFISASVQTLLGTVQLELTPREFQIMQLVCDGLSNAQIAEQLSLSPKTTDKHRENLMRKLGVNNSAQLIRKALQLGILDSH
ncbi:LuxR C-terminal-related transcriptional regulator [Rheinheimera texasensis]|jgi:DNA-binding NarL/FixJ family response regulator|uniref:LuxR C-terminal-related transcriptional regulator n=1 Tax=Rheinheimera texasensis TaxID=306205 RepID=UPI0004E0BE82|nr:response regulator transcription factor [Rheinheimera texasensis]